MIEFDYAPGDGLPAIPVIYIALSYGAERVGGPAILDTGFDGGIYPNGFLYESLKDLEFRGKEILKDVTGTIICNTLEVEAEIFHRETGLTKALGDVVVYLPENPVHRSENVIVGREILNELDIRLNDGKVSIY